MYREIILHLSKLPRWIIGPMILVWALSIMANPEALYIYTVLFTVIVLCLNLIKTIVRHPILRNTFQKIICSLPFLLIGFFLQLLGLIQIYIISSDYPRWLLVYGLFVLPLIMVIAQFDLLSRRQS